LQPGGIVGCEAGSPEAAHAECPDETAPSASGKNVRFRKSMSKGVGESVVVRWSPSSAGTGSASMRGFASIAFAAGVCFRACFGASAAAEEADLVEFGRVEAAQQFGWEALRGAVLHTEDSAKIGRHALRAAPGPQPQDYMGIGLRRDIDLSGAGPEDRILFFVKQNFGVDLCINVHTAKGNVWRFPKVKRGDWTRVEVDLDLAKWEQSEKRTVDAWSKVHYLHIYSKGFDKEGEYMLLDGFSAWVRGKPVIVRSPPGPG